MQERRNLLLSNSRIATEIFLEPVMPYDAEHSLKALGDELGIDSSTVELVGRALFGKYAASNGEIHIRDHQAQAMRTLFSANSKEKNIVVTSGTGSGKTESFLLPILLRLTLEAKSWSEQAKANAEHGKADVFPESFVCHGLLLGFDQGGGDALYDT